ncbi:hypothetical protein GUJ93_ZPchr0010g10641 [Zizania palustris]|uniref:Uncharacterized protein n=1 Tax=Zizania palustris TaxID=103762 RepID=A0A8J5W9P6_ZIZPA|nr:hypothetical protein GUJ93_ZPchr0010g10641 [Zizania palustris]
MEGDGRSWTFPVYILSNEMADVLPGDEDDLPPNGANPHPFDGQVYPGEPAWVQQWVDDQMFQVPFNIAPVVDQEVQVEPLFAEPMVDDVHWDQWPNQPIVEPPAPQPQEEISLEVSDLSIGINSGSTTLSTNSSSLLALVNSVQHAIQDSVPQQIASQGPSRPPIRFFYSRRNRKAQDDNLLAQQTSVTATGSSSKGGKGKGKEIMPDQPTLQDFLNVSLSNGQHVNLAKLMKAVQDTSQTVHARGQAEGDADEETN